MIIGPHWITGNGVGFKPDILDMDVMERVLEVSTEYDSIWSVHFWSGFYLNVNLKLMFNSSGRLLVKMQ